MSRTTTRVTVALATTGLLMSVPVGTAFAGHHSSPATVMAPVTPAVPTVGSLSAHLRLTITTTSGSTAVRFSPGTVAAQHVTSLTGSAAVVPLADGVQVNGGTAGATAVVDAVFYEATQAPNVAVTVTKGAAGQTKLDIDNRDAATPVAVLRGVTDRLTSSTGTNPLTTNVSRGALFTATPVAQPRADARALTLAFYYPWFASYTDPTLADVPSNPRTSWDIAAVNSMTAQAKANGVNGFVVSYAGDASDGPGFDIARKAAETNGQYITGYLETPRATSATSGGNADPNVVRDWLVQLLKRAPSAAFLKAADGVPVVFVYGMAHLLPKHWAAIQDNLQTAYGLTVHLVGDATDPTYLPYEWGVHRYDVLDSQDSLTGWSRDTSLAARASSIVDSTVAPKLYVGTASPGFDDTKLRGSEHPVISRDGGNRYKATWSAALAGQPDWVVVTSWNEWFEDSQIEPGVGTGSQALTDTATQAAAFRTAPR